MNCSFYILIYEETLHKKTKFPKKNSTFAPYYKKYGKSATSFFYRNR